jgi:hypothetical protein
MGLVRATSSDAQLPAGIALRESGFQARIYTDKTDLFADGREAAMVCKHIFCTVGVVM